MKRDQKKERFIKAWEESQDIRQLAKKLGITYGSARTMAWKYRKKGLITTKKSTGRKVKDAR